jgi:ABC-type branched-subunit amino acid transport system ATPase component/ABC-type branched-subunit amino acid transport system permease subunit
MYVNKKMMSVTATPSKKIYAIVILLFAVLPWLPVNGFLIYLLQTFAYTAMAVIGLNLLLGLSGQMSLGQAGFYAIGAYCSALLAMKLGLPIVMCILFGTLMSGLAGALVGIFALRSKGLYLAMTTLSVGFILNIISQRWVSVTGGTMGLSGVPQLELGNSSLSSTAYYYLAGVFLIAVQLMADFINQSRIGRNLRAIKESEIFAESVGIEVGWWKSGIFAFSAALAGMGGAFFVHQSGFVGSDAFTVRLSIGLLIAAVIGGLGSQTGPLMGTLMLLGIVEVIAGMDKLGLIVYGAILLIVLLSFPKGLVGGIQSLTKYFQSFAKNVDAPNKQNKAQSALNNPYLNDKVFKGNELKIEGLSKSYRGVKAVDNVSLHIQRGEIHGLIGPNGAGKSTIINLIAGIYAADSGSIRLLHNGGNHGADIDITNLKTTTRANLGIARTFQNLQLIEEVTALDNVLLGVMKKGNFTGDFRRWLNSSLEVEEREKALSIMSFLGIAHHAHQFPHSMPYGHRKLLEFARAIAQNPQFLLLDEPIAGINTHEANEIAKVIRLLKASGMTILLVEHNMEFVMSLCDKVSVLNFGKLIESGSPQIIQNSPQVIEAYLGVRK